MNISIECPVIDELEAACANASGLYGGIALMAGEGKLGALAKDFQNLANEVAKSGNPANLSVARGRQGDAIRRIKRQLDSLHGEIHRGANGSNGVHSQYLAERVEFLKGEAERLQQEIARLNALGGEELIREMVPEVAPHGRDEGRACAHARRCPVRPRPAASRPGSAD